MSDYFEIESLAQFAMEARADWLLDVLREQRLYSVFQPIVRCARRAEDNSGKNNVANESTAMSACCGPR